VNVLPGDVLTILTPGGGGYGLTNYDTNFIADISKSFSIPLRTGGSLQQYSLDQESA
jgi:N-methylhydantoinase B/oxoprolinase/acetone carboxylase alpha subunit